MAGQIIKRGERTWLVRIFMGRDAKGKQIFHHKTIHGTKKDAEQYRNKVVREKDLGVFVEPAALAVDEYLDKWLQTAARPRLRERTFVDYSEVLKRYVRPTVGAKRLCDVRPLDIQNIYTEMLERGLSARSVRYTHAVFSSALKQAVKWNMLTQNPAEQVELPRATRKEMQSLTAEDAGRFLLEARKDRLSALFAMALATGMRPEEYLALQWKDVDLETRIVTVQRALVWNRKGGGWTFTAPKTARSRRNIPLPESLAQALTAHRRRQSEARLKAGTGYQKYDLVFATRDGTPIMPRNLLSRHFKPILKRAKLPHSVRLYDLRHTCASLLLAANEHPKIVSERLGHASIVLTLDTYSHVLPSMQQAATDKLEKMLFAK
jgi:integrase